MSNLQAVNKPKRACVLRSIVVGHRRLVLYESLQHVLALQPTKDDPITVTLAKAGQMTGLSRRTLDRMIAAGRESVAA